MDYLNNLIGNVFDDYIVESVNNKEITIKCLICSNIKKIKTHQIKTCSYKHSASNCKDKYYINEIGKIYEDYQIISVLGKYNKSPEVYCKAKCLRCDTIAITKLSAIKKGLKHGKYCIKQLSNSDIKKVIIERFYDMYNRCNNPNNNNYLHYGGRGIKLMYDNPIDLYNDFAEELKNHAKIHGLHNSTFDRIDVNGNYEKSNLRITTQTIQNINTTRKRLFIVKKGNEVILSDSAMEVGRKYKANGRAIGNLIRGKSKSSFGFRLVGVYSPNSNINELIRKENVTTNLVMS
jgi:hypothetical protein